MRKMIFIILFTFSAIGFGQTFSLSDTEFQIGDKLITHEIVFGLDKDIIDDQKSLAYLDKIFEFLEKNPNLKIEIGVHIHRWSDMYSLCLTCRRARHIKNLLVKKGIDSVRITDKGYDDKQPLISNPKTNKELLYNDRVEFLISETNQL